MMDKWQRFWSSRSFSYLCMSCIMLDSPLSTQPLFGLSCNVSPTLKYNTFTSKGGWLRNEPTNGCLLDYSVHVLLTKYLMICAISVSSLSVICPVSAYEFDEFFAVTCLFCPFLSLSFLMCLATNPTLVLCLTLWRQILR